MILFNLNVSCIILCTLRSNLTTVRSLVSVHTYLVKKSDSDSSSLKNKNVFFLISFDILIHHSTGDIYSHTQHVQLMKHDGLTHFDLDSESQCDSSPQRDTATQRTESVTTHTFRINTFFLVLRFYLCVSVSKTSSHPQTFSPRGSTLRQQQ